MTQPTLFGPGPRLRIHSWRGVAGLLLHVANSSPPVFQREFYAMKERILRRLGRHVGWDLQYIRHDCWACNGTGMRPGTRYGPERYQCFKCGGTGIHREKWVWLERWTLGGYEFHIPRQQMLSRPSEYANIIGRIEHERFDGHHAHEAARWLFLLFAPSRWFRCLTSCYAYRPHWWMVQMHLGNAMHWAGGVLRRFKRHRCYCGRTWVQGLDDGGWCVCPRCRSNTNPIPF